ncbi:acyl-coenzyme A oxidase 3, peroxisomal isoform X2 [Glycine max]|uniref:acyl-coenzyme A oxidase 3, peroxisomal isoform X2 n=1 Tax=Glycine max TaxID=3847 RepID=UPI0003DEBA4C|nr:acyl-coenzyme A oxidase 3, peroxisomal isoform X2 [Glycine max]
MTDNDRVSRRTEVLTNHLLRRTPPPSLLRPLPCLSYSPPELSNTISFDTREMRKLMDCHNLEDRDWLFSLILQSPLFNPRHRAGRFFVCPDYNQPMEHQRQATMKRIAYLLDKGVFRGWLTGNGPEQELRKLALHEVIGMYDHSLAVKLGVHFFLWGGAVKFLGTKRHHDKWLNSTENYDIKGCFAMSELGHGSNVRGIETVTTYDSNTGEFVINTPCESGQKYWIGGAANRFAAFLAPLTSGRVTIAVSAVYISKISLAIAIRYALTRRAFSITPNGPEVLLLDYPSHQRRLLPLLAKVYAMSFAANELKMMYVNRTPKSNKAIHIVSSAYKATLTWNNMRTLQECREACGGQGVKSENRVGNFMGEFDVHSTFEGDNNVLMQQISKALFAEYVASQKKKKPFSGLGLEHMNKPLPVIPSQLTSSYIRNSEFQIDLFHLRERDLLRRFAEEVSEYQSRGESKESAFILSYQLAEELGRAFSERAILKTFMEAESTVPAGSLKNVLGLLRSLYAVICVDEDSAFLRYGYLSTENASAVRKEVPKLCAELRPHALALVSSFGIPDAFLSPIAYNWVDSNSWSSQL